jgi:hypothetical protein
MICSAWKGGTFGIRVGKANVHKYFQRNWASIVVIIDGKTHVFNLSKAFWTNCPEIRSKTIGVWLHKYRLDCWPKWNPPKVKLVLLRSNKFNLVK